MPRLRPKQKQHLSYADNDMNRPLRKKTDLFRTLMVVIIVLSSIPVMIAALGIGTTSLPENFERHELNAGDTFNAHYHKESLSDHAETLRPRKMFRKGPATGLSSTGSKNVSQDSIEPRSVPNREKIVTETSHSNIIDVDTDVASSVMSTFKQNVRSKTSLEKKELRVVSQTSKEENTPVKTRTKTPTSSRTKIRTKTLTPSRTKTRTKIPTPSRPKNKVPTSTETSNKVPRSSQTRKKITASSHTKTEQKTDKKFKNIAHARNSSRLRNIATRVHHELGNLFDPAPRLLSVPDPFMDDDCSISASAKLLAEQLARATQQKPGSPASDNFLIYDSPQTRTSTIRQLILKHAAELRLNLYQCYPRRTKRAKECKTVHTAEGDKPRFSVYFGRSVKWGFHRQLKDSESYVYVVMTRDPLIRRIRQFEAWTSARPGLVAKLVKKGAMGATLSEDLLQCQSREDNLAGLFHDNFGVANSVTGRDRMKWSCTFARHFVVLSSTHVTQSLQLLWKLFGQAPAKLAMSPAEADPKSGMTVTAFKSGQGCLATQYSDFFLGENLRYFQQEAFRELESTAKGMARHNAVSFSGLSVDPAQCDVEGNTDALMQDLGPYLQWVRARQTNPDAELAKPVYFLVTHYPKTAGTTLRNMLRDYCNKNQIHFVSFYAARGSKVLANFPNSAFQIHYGHRVTWGYHERLPKGVDYVYITMTRDPVAREISHYIFNKEKRSSNFQDHVAKGTAKATLDAQLRAISTDIDYSYIGLIKFAFAGKNQLSIQQQERTKHLCLMSRHFLITSTEHFDESLEMLAELFPGFVDFVRNSKRDKHANSMVVNKNEPIITTQALEKAMGQLQYEYRVFNFLQQLMATQQQRMKAAQTL